jgi:hypothetical protein
MKQVQASACNFPQSFLSDGIRQQKVKFLIQNAQIERTEGFLHVSSKNKFTESFPELND